MRINYTLNSENKIVSWSSYPLREDLPTIEIDNPHRIILGYDSVINGIYVSGVLEFRNQKKIDKQRNEINRQIDVLKTKLQESDYRLYKYIEGFYTEEEYAPYKIERQSWRNEINELEAKLKNLGS